MSEKVQVEDHKNLYRDSNSKAIINSNNDEYAKYMQAYKKRVKSKQKYYWNDANVDPLEFKKEIRRLKGLIYNN